MKLKKPPKLKKQHFSFPKNHDAVEKDSKEERAEKDRLIKAWLKRHKIKKIPPAFII